VDIEAGIEARLADELGYDTREGTRVDVTEITTVPVGSIIAARRDGAPVAVARLRSGKLVVVDDRCPHDGGRISDGYVDGDNLVCARHGWTLEAYAGTCRRVCKLRE
jgi:nitrite reductase/ring-hydroxylating ferredoxin subunit